MDQAAAETNWQGVVASALVPLVVAAGFVYTALIPGWRPSETWVWGLFLLFPLEFVRAVILAALCVAYRSGSSPWDAAKIFLFTIAILLAGGIVWLFLEGGGDLLLEPMLYKAAGLPLLITLADSIIGILTFRGDPQAQGDRLDALSTDSYNWLRLSVYVLVTIVVVYLLLFGAHSVGWRFAAWVPALDTDLAIRFALVFLACYYVGKAVIVSYVQTARFTLTKKPLLDVPWLQRVLQWRPRRERRFDGRDTEREAADRYQNRERPQSVLKFQEDLIHSLKEKSDRRTEGGDK